MSYHNSNGSGGVGGANSIMQHQQRMMGDYSGDDRESRSGGEERSDSEFQLHDKPIYLLEHLATFTVNKETGIVYPADGMRRLLQLEKSTGIWSQKMQLCLNYQWVLIMDYETGNVIERFPAKLIQEPTAFTSNDAMELYNNILVFIVTAGSSGSRSEMHIFQSQSVSAVHLVEELKNLRSGRMRNATEQLQQHSNYKDAQQSMQNLHSQSQSHYQRNLSGFEQYTACGIVVGNGETDSEQGGISGGIGLSTNNFSTLANDETSSTSSDKRSERDVTVLNHCFDDIEKFIARLQHAAAASRELERRRRNRKSKKKDPGEGLLMLRTRPPHEKEFIDIFAKFKLSFNLLAKLKAHIHDPNAPELVHFLFTPLALIVEASSDTYYEAQLPTRVINPLLTREAINLLVNCVTSKETELWRSLGDAWIIPRDQWKDDIGSYHPVFLDGWSPDYIVVDELEPLGAAVANVNSTQPSTPTNINIRRQDAHQQQQQQQQQQQHHHNIKGRGLVNTIGSTNASGSYDDFDGRSNIINEKYSIHHGQQLDPRSGSQHLSEFNTQRSEISIDSIERTNQNRSNNSSNNNNSSSAAIHSITSGLQNLHTRDARNSDAGILNDSHMTGNSNANITDDQLLESWLEDLQASGAKIVLVTYPRSANNDKELSVVRGEYLEILDDTRKWWKARNIRGQVAHVPHTIVTPYNYGGGVAALENTNNNSVTHYSASSPINETSADWIRNKHLVNNKQNDSIEKELEKHIKKSSASTNISMHDELKQVLQMRDGQRIDFHKTPPIYIDKNSSVADVANWLQGKKFSLEVQQGLSELNGTDIFALTGNKFEELFGSKEGRRLLSQLQLQKSVSGYQTLSSTELKSVLSRTRLGI